MHPYRTHNCGELRREHAGATVRLSGWVFRKRDHGSLLFVDLRDHYGVTQIVVQPDRSFFGDFQKIKLESVITVTGKVEMRSADTINSGLPTGEVELLAEEVKIEGMAEALPLCLTGDDDGPEEMRLKYRFLDLRRDRLHRNIMLRSKVISDIRRRMTEEHGFNEFQTPILTSSSPEGARDYLVPSRVHPGEFYALPLSPQQFKLLLMLAGFDRYFQIAPCFRDEDARADRSPGEHYQLDIEMSFVTQDEVFAVVESVLSGIFSKFSDWKSDATPFRRIPYAEAMVKYGSDKPDLRIPLQMCDVSDVFTKSKFNAFRTAVEKGGVVRALPVRKIADKPRNFFDKLEEHAKSLGSKGLGYIIWHADGAKGPIAKFLSAEEICALTARGSMEIGDVMFFIADTAKNANRISGDIRLKIGRDLNLVEKGVFRFCWITDFPFYEHDEESKAVIFSHNPFSMPQGGLQSLQEKNPLEVLAYQYDVVCNGVELGSGAIRNHQPEVMYKAFEIAGYKKEDVDTKFAGLINAFRLGAPPHAGIAPGIDRMVMMLSHEENIREVIAFPMNQRAQDLMMNAPSEVTIRQLRELHIKVNLPKKHEDQPVTGAVVPAAEAKPAN